MSSVTVSISIPGDVYADIAQVAKDRDATMSKMLVYYAVQGYGLELRGFHVVAAPLDKRYLGPPPKSWILPFNLENPRPEIEAWKHELEKRMAKK